MESHTNISPKEDAQKGDALIGDALRFSTPFLNKARRHFSLPTNYQQLVPKRISSWALIVTLLTLQSCSGSTNSGDNNGSVEPGTGAAQNGAGQSGNTQPLTSGVLEALDDSVFKQQSATDQYQILNKLMATVYRGIPVNEYFAIEQGLDALKILDNAPSPESVYATLTTRLSDQEIESANLNLLGSANVDFYSDVDVEPRFDFSEEEAREIPLARMYSYPLSFDMLSQWMAWQLANSILFSPSAEMDSVDMTDVQNVFRRLDKAIISGTPIRQLVFEHMRSIENWRRFRSPEDNTREMMEIFLGYEDLDEQVPAASKACQDLFLTSENEGYLLSYTDFPNSEYQTVLNQTILDCDDFYQVVAGHERLIPTIATQLVRYFFSERSPEFQQSVIDQLIAENPEYFEELFLPILFSREYLIRTERLKSFEESFLGTAQRINWQAPQHTFRGLASGRGGSGRTYMTEMGWPAMSAKLGRNTGIPTDSLSFANYHKALREDLLLPDYRWRESLGISEPTPPDLAPPRQLPIIHTQKEANEYEQLLAEYSEAVERLAAQEQYDHHVQMTGYIKNSSLHELVKGLSVEAFIDYLFLSMATRKASPVEIRKIVQIFNKEEFLREEDEGIYINRWHRSNAAVIVFDYLSRLPETYYQLAQGE